MEQLAAELGMGEQDLREILLDGGSEAVTPTLLTVNPDGTVSATFTGHVIATGLDLDAGPIAATSLSQAVRWLRNTDSRMASYLAASEGTQGGRTITLANVLGAFNDFGHPATQIFMHSQGADATPSEILIGAGDVANTQSALKVLLRSDGSSQFLQLATVEQAALDFGEGVLNWSGGNSFSDTLVVNHALGRVPFSVLLTPWWRGAFTRGDYTIATVRSASATQVLITATTADGSVPAGGTQVRVDWAVIG